MNNLTAEQLPNLLDRLKYTLINDHNLQEHVSNPVVQLLIEKVNGFSSEELSIVEQNLSTNKKVLYKSLYDYAYEFKLPTLFEVLINKEVPCDKLPYNTHKILSEIKNPTVSIYYALIMAGKQKDKQDFFETLVHFCSNMDTPEKLKLADITYNEYYKNKINDLHDCIFNRHSDRISLFYINKLIEDKIDINKNFPLDRFLPKYKEKDFFISSSYTEQIKNLVELGFRFNDKEYRFNGETLAFNLFSFRLPQMIEAILPALTQFEPILHTVEEQEAIIKTYEKKIPHIFQLYMKLKIENKLSDNSAERAQPKPLKI